VTGMGDKLVRSATTLALAAFGFVMGGVAWDELVRGFQLPDAFWIPFFGLLAFAASMAWLTRHLEPLLPKHSDGQPRWMIGELASFVFFIPGGALFIARSVLHAPRNALRGASKLLWLGWAISCTGMQISMVAELSEASLTLTFDGLYATFGVLNAVVVTALMWWTPPREPLRRTEIHPAAS
jgi:hypothetical protein